MSEDVVRMNRIGYICCLNAGRTNGKKIGENHREPLLLPNNGHCPVPPDAARDCTKDFRGPRFRPGLGTAWGGASHLRPEAELFTMAG